MANLVKVDEEVERLKSDIVRIGTGNAEGQYVVRFADLFDDPEVENFYEALMGTLKAARRKGVIAFEGMMLLKGPNDNVPITLLVPPGDAPAPPAPEEAAPEPEAAPAPSPAPVAPAPAPAASGGEAAAEAEDEVPVPEGVMSPTSSAKFKRAGGMQGPMPTEQSPESTAAFENISRMAPDMQCEFFLKSFIFALKDEWKAVPELLKRFQKHAKDTGENDHSMNHIQAADFLQKNGKTRTGSERRAELNDVDVNNDGQISFIEYLLLHYKVMILEEFYKRYEQEPAEDLTNDGIGICTVGFKLVDELLTLPKGMNPALEAAIESFTEEKKAREARITKLQAKAAAGGVKGMAAQNELIILEQGDTTELNRIELTLQAAMRRADKRRGSELLAQQKAEAEAELKRAHEEQRAKMAARRAMFEKK